MKTEVSIVDRYAKADPWGRIDIILLNYSNFLEIVDGCEESLKFLIVNERRINRKRSLGDLGVRVQSSGMGDKTAQEAINIVMLDEAIRSKDYEIELKGTDCPEKHREEIEILYDMRDDYSLVRSQMKMLPVNESILLSEYLTERTDLTSFAEMHGMSYGTMQKRLNRVRRRLKNQTVIFLNEKYEMKCGVTGYGEQ